MSHHIKVLAIHIDNMCNRSQSIVLFEEENRSAPQRHPNAVKSGIAYRL
jgi:hypothetical protein